MDYAKTLVNPDLNLTLSKLPKNYVIRINFIIALKIKDNSKVNQKKINFSNLKIAFTIRLSETMLSWNEVRGHILGDWQN